MDERAIDMAKIELAIVGMGFHVGEYHCVEDFMKGLVVSKKVFKSGLQKDDKTSFDTNLLIEKTMREALTDAGLSEDEKRKTAFIWHYAKAPREKCFTVGGDGKKVAIHFGLEGPSYTIYDGENSIFRGLTLARDLIAEKNASVVTICVTPPLLATVENEADYTAEGSIVFVLKEKEQAIESHNKIYACVSALTMIEKHHDLKDLSKRNSIGKEFIATLEDGGVAPGEVRVVEVPKGESSSYYDVMKEVCDEEITDYLVGENFLLGENKSFMGEQVEISIAASFVKHALQLFFYHVFIFQSKSAEGVSFFVDKDPSLWNDHLGRRTTVITSKAEGDSVAETHSRDGAIGFAVLTDGVDTMEEDRKLRTRDGLLPVACNNPKELFYLLQALKDLILKESKGQHDHDSLKQFCKEVWLAYQQVKNPKYTLVLVFDTVDALMSEIELILEREDDFSINRKFDPSFIYTSKRGSYFTGQPHGKKAKVVYMNPPGSAQHMLLFYEMLTLFPSFRNVYSQVMNGRFATKMNEMDYRFGRFGMEILMIGLVDRIAKKRFGLSPDILTGASLGEIATLFAYDCMETDLQYMDTPEIMRLLEAFRDTYEVVPYELSVKYVKADIDEIKEKADQIEDVYILVYASPYGAFMSGRPESMEEFVKKNHFMSWELDLNSAIHTPHVEKFYDVVYQANLACETKFRQDLDVEIYSTYSKEPVENTLEKIAEFVAAILIKPCDFHGLLEVLYERGSRVFIDMSTGGTCLAWAEETFAERDTLCFSIYPSFMDSRGSLIKTFAKLLSNNIKFDLDIFLDSFEFLYVEESNPIDLSEILTSSDTELTVWPREENLVPARITTEEGLEENIIVKATPAPVVASIDSVADQVESITSTLEGEALVVQHFVEQNSLTAYRLYLEHENFLLHRILNKNSFAVTKPMEKPVKKPEEKLDVKAIEKPDKKLIEKTIENPDEKITERPCIWDYDDIVEITTGSPSKVWGEKYTALDEYRKRARLPAPPFMFVHRVVAIDAEFGEFRPSSIDVEYDITDECILRLSDSKVSILLLTEASQIAILLLSYIGIDITYGGVSYRILNSSTKLFSDFPIKGETICSRLEFVEFIKSGTITLVKSNYTSHVDGKLLMNIDVLGGFFTEEDLKEKGMGLLPMKKPDPATLMGRAPLAKMKPRKDFLTDLTMFYDGDYDVYFYRKRFEMDVEKLYIEPEIRMVDRIISMDLYGGDYGRGQIIAEKNISKDHWSFAVHFINDPVFPGSLLVEGASHLQMMYALNAGYAIPGEKYILSFEQDRAIIATFRGQVRQMDSVVRFVLQVKEVKELHNGVMLVSDCDVHWQDSIVARVEELSVILEEK